MSDYYIINNSEQAKELLRAVERQTPSFLFDLINGRYRLFEERDNIDILTLDIAEEYDVNIDMDTNNGIKLEGNCNIDYRITYDECGVPTMLVRGDLDEDDEIETIKYCEENFGMLDLSYTEEVYVLPAHYPLNSLEDIYYNYDINTTQNINIYHLTEDTVDDLSPIIYHSFCDRKFDHNKFYELEDLRPKIYDQLNTKPELEENEIYMIHNYRMNYATYIKINNINKKENNINLSEQKLTEKELKNKFDINKSRILSQII